MEREKQEGKMAARQRLADKIAPGMTRCLKLY